jgi:hypothetical protein
MAIGSSQGWPLISLAWRQKLAAFWSIAWPGALASFVLVSFLGSLLSRAGLPGEAGRPSLLLAIAGNLLFLLLQGILVPRLIRKRYRSSNRRISRRCSGRHHTFCRRGGTRGDTDHFAAGGVSDRMFVRTGLDETKF